MASPKKCVILHLLVKFANNCLTFTKQRQSITPESINSKSMNNNYGLLAIKQLIVTFSVAISCMWLFQLLCSIIFKTSYFAEEISIYSHFVLIMVIILWSYKKYSMKSLLRKCPMKIMLYCPIIAVLILTCFVYLGTFVRLPNIFKKEMDVLTESLLGILTLGTLNPIAEEFLFRGILLENLLKQYKQPWIAIGVSALLFSLIHFNLAQIPWSFIYGIVLGWIYYKTKTLWPCIIIHTTNNLICCLTAFSPLGTIIDIAIEKYLLLGLFVIVPICLIPLVYIFGIIYKST